MKKLTIILTFLGLVVITGAMAWNGFDSVLHAITRIGVMGFFVIIACQVMIDGLLGGAWYSAFPELGLLHLIFSRMVRDSAAACLPFSQVGGIVFGVRATCARRKDRKFAKKDIDLPQSVCANLVDITTEVMGQIGFVLIAVGLLILHDPKSPYVIPVTIGAFLLVLGNSGFIWTQLHGGDLCRKIDGFFAGSMPPQWKKSLFERADLMQELMGAAWDRKGRVAFSAFAHFLCWLAGAAILWVTLLFLGAHLNYFDAVAIEGVTSGIMSLGFLVPASLGVQEGAYMGMAHAFGIDYSVALGISLLRRAREIVIGIPVLFTWQFMEVHGLRDEHQQSNTVEDQHHG